MEMKNTGVSHMKELLTFWNMVLTETLWRLSLVEWWNIVNFAHKSRCNNSIPRSIVYDWGSPLSVIFNYGLWFSVITSCTSGSKIKASITNPSILKRYIRQSIYIDTLLYIYYINYSCHASWSVFRTIKCLQAAVLF